MKGYTKILLAVSSIVVLNACQPAHDWLPQYPDSYQPKVASELVSTYDRDSILVTGLTILEIADLYANEQGEVWSVEGGGDIRYAADGEHFERIAVPTEAQLNVVSGIGDECWIGGVNNVMLHCKGKVCTREPLPGKKAIVWGVNMADNKEGWARSNKNDNVVYRRKNGKWQLLDSMSRYEVDDMWCARDGKECWAIGTDNKLLHFKNEVWEVTQLADKRWELSLAMSEDGKTGWAYGAVTYHYSNGKWEQQFISLNGVSLMRCSADGSECWAAGDKGDVFHYYNGKWEALPVVTDLWSPQKIWFSKQECWIACLQGVYHTTDKRYFSKVNLGEKATEGTAIAANSRNIWIGGWDYNVFKIERRSTHFYPTLSSMQYDKNSMGDSIRFDFMLHTKSRDMAEQMPDSLWLNAFTPGDSVHPNIVICPFSSRQVDSFTSICSVTVAMDSLFKSITPLTPEKVHLSLSYMTNGGTEVVTYDLKDRLGLLWLKR